MPEILTLRRMGILVTIIADPETASWVRFRSNQYFEVHTCNKMARRNDWIVFSDHSFVPRGMAYEDQEIVNEDGGTISCRHNVSKRLVSLSVKDQQWRQLYVLRIVRSIFRWELFKAGAVFLHANALSFDNNVVALMGRRASGKTNLALELLRDGEWNFTTEDDLTIVTTGDQILALGWPGCFRVRLVTLSEFPRLDSNKHKFLHPTNRRWAKKDNLHNRLNIFPEELQRIFPFTIQSDGKLSALIWLDDEVSAEMPRQLTTLETLERLRNSWDVLPERKPGTNPRGATPLPSFTTENTFYPFLAEAYGCRVSDGARALLERVSHAIPGYLISVNRLRAMSYLKVRIKNETPECKSSI
jgi:hypothetical protein